MIQLRTKRFPCCMELKTGCIYIGTITAYCNAFFAIVCLFVLVYNNPRQEDDVGAYIFVSYPLILIPLIGVYVSILFLQGVETKKPRRFTYFLVYLGVEIASCVFAAGFTGSSGWLVPAFILIYFFACVCSLRMTLKPIDNQMTEIFGPDACDKYSYQNVN